ncbi:MULTISPECIES: MarR family winged helix-turn-helix transcriptional regulator [Methylobacterium]|uniref:MarR family winged helix-turn-helix transcriptional regulator n=1 Tax=Methylobacterium TaxID=407 RepID=UPI00258CCBBF|nr:MarR family transcriptional regulator [Methylobacterium sp.]MBY0294619.1 MarR family transcriptional regulator [Methylobacterium sp.]
MQREFVGLAHLEGLLGYTLRRTQVAISRSFVQIFSDLDVRQTQLGVLNVIEGTPGLKPSQIGALIGIKRANVGPLLDELERRGLVRREPAPADRRSHALFLTEAGAALMTELHRREAAHEERIATLLEPEERAVLLRLLRRVEQGCRDMADEEAGPEGDEGL